MKASKHAVRRQAKQDGGRATFQKEAVRRAQGVQPLPEGENKGEEARESNDYK